MQHTIYDIKRCSNTLHVVSPGRGAVQHHKELKHRLATCVKPRCLRCVFWFEIQTVDNSNYEWCFVAPPH